MGNKAHDSISNPIKVTFQAVQNVSNAINRAAENINTEYRQLIDTNLDICENTRGSVAQNMKSAIESIEDCIQETKDILIQVSDTINLQNNSIKYIDERAASSALGGRRR